MSNGFFSVRCDNCGKDFPILYALHFFTKDWHLCAPCCASLRFIMKNYAPVTQEAMTPGAVRLKRKRIAHA